MSLWYLSLRYLPLSYLAYRCVASIKDYPLFYLVYKKSFVEPLSRIFPDYEYELLLIPPRGIVKIWGVDAWGNTYYEAYGRVLAIDDGESLDIKIIKLKLDSGRVEDMAIKTESTNIVETVIKKGVKNVFDLKKGEFFNTRLTIGDYVRVRFLSDLPLNDYTGKKINSIVEEIRILHVIRGSLRV